MSDEPEVLEEDEGEEDEAPTAPPAGYIPEGAPTGGQSVEERGQVVTYDAEGNEVNAGLPGDDEEEAPA